MTFEEFFDKMTEGKSEKQIEGFVSFLKEKTWNIYRQYIMDKILIVENEVKAMTLNIPNAKEGKPYSSKVEIPNEQMTLSSVSGISKDIHGLTATVTDEGKSFVIEGTPNLDSFRENGESVQNTTFDIVLSYKYKGLELEDRPLLEKKVQLIINQDPRKLWKNLPVDWENMPEPKYENEDTQCEYIKVDSVDGDPQKDIVAASKRGRSHAQEAKPRDDHFKMKHLDNGWYIMAVADGAGSAQYSREGSRIACTTAVDYCQAQLLTNDDFEEHIKTYNEYKDESESVARKLVGDYIYNIVGTAAFKAQREIIKEATDKNIPSKKYATTLLLSICKKFSFGWFVASFWVGDGALCLYNKEAHTAKLLGVPDEGEYAGQTRFLTMPEIFKDPKALYQRLRFNIVPDFTALFLMSDGVSDPKFETDANLNNPDKWDALWEDLTKNEEHPVDLSDDHEEAKQELLDWLDFWVPGNHDDRTIAILY